MTYNRLKEVLQCLNQDKPIEEHITYSTIAKSIGRTEASVKQWINNERQPSMKTLLSLAKLLKIPLAQLCPPVPIPTEDMKRLEKVVNDFDPCALSLEEFKAWSQTDAYGNPTTQQNVSKHLIAILLKQEEFEKLDFLKKNKP